jgi:sugar phosphate isomerase/epimerase
MLVVVGTIAERDDPAQSWADQLAAVERHLVALAPVLRANGVRLLLKTHEEITSFEILRLVAAVGVDVLGVAFDPVNVWCRLEDPLAAARRLAPVVAQIHLDDAVLAFEAAGMRRYLAPMGAGALDWPALAAALPEAGRAVPRWIELHRGQFAMPVFEAGWLAAQPDLTLAEYAAVLARAAAFGGRPIPCDQDRPLDRLPAMLAALGLAP